jgi:hypothetical protein
MKKNYEVTLRIPEDVLKKLIVVSNAENRSLNNQLLMMARKNIEYFERAKSKITPAQLSEVDLSEYSEEKADKKAED